MSRFEDDLVAWRNESPAPIRRMLMSHFERHVWLSASLKELVTGQEPRDQWIALFPQDAAAGSRPSVCLTVHDGARLNDVSMPVTVLTSEAAQRSAEQS